MPHQQPHGSYTNTAPRRNGIPVRRYGRLDRYSLPRRVACRLRERFSHSQRSARFWQPALTTSGETFSQRLRRQMGEPGPELSTATSRRIWTKPSCCWSALFLSVVSTEPDLGAGVNGRGNLESLSQMTFACRCSNPPARRQRLPAAGFPAMALAQRPDAGGRVPPGCSRVSPRISLSP